jgi:peptidylprolyl isomerase
LANKKSTRKGNEFKPKESAQAAKSSNKLPWPTIVGGIVVVAAIALIVYPLLSPSEGDIKTTPSGLKYRDRAIGSGESPSPGKQVTVHYTGTLVNGTKFDSSVDRGQPFTFMIGTGSVIKGWDEGVMTMKVGGKRQLIIPPNLGYGARASGPIPANSTLHFEVELLGVK